MVAIASAAAQCNSISTPAEPVGQQMSALVFSDGGCDFPIDATEDLSPIVAGNVAMNSDTINNGQFVRWVGQRSQSQTALVESQIAAGASSVGTMSTLNGRLNTAIHPITELSAGIILLSIIGQANKSSSVTPLHDFIWQVARVGSCNAGDAAAGDGSIDGYDVSPLDCDPMLRARAVEMLAFIETANPVVGTPLMSNTLTIAETHPNAAVRQAAINAYMFNLNDTPDAAAYLTSQIDASDLVYLGRPRMYDGMDAAAFDLALASYYDAHLDQLPILDATTDVVLTTQNCNLDGGF